VKAVMDHSNYNVETMISAKSIAARCEELAEDISLYFKNTDKLIVVGLLRGSFVFIADLARELDLPCEVDFLETSSYGNSTESSREVRILNTLHHVKTLLESRKPARLKVCALLDKPARREVEIKADWIGFEIPDEFVVGYGIDYAQRNRNLDHIGKVVFK
jgi:hypoxanthine phosphoribosyltransferase